MLVSNCCSWPVRDEAGEGVGGLDICTECGEWCEIVELDDDESDDSNVDV